jgi:hypothetical protein
MHDFKEAFNHKIRIMRRKRYYYNNKKSGFLKLSE